MDYGFKFTTHGLSVLAACADTGAPLKLTRVLAGNGVVPEGTNLADMHQLVHYVTDATIGDRRHKDNKLWIDIGYSNVSHPELPLFYLSEFIIYAEHPDTGEETDFLYATLGDYRQPIPPYSAKEQATNFIFPVVIDLSNEVEVTIDAEPSLVTYSELIDLLNDGQLGAASTEITIPTEGWQADTETDGMYAVCVDIPVEGASPSMIPILTVQPKSLGTATACGLGAFVQTISGGLRVYSVGVPAKPITASLALMGISPYASAHMTLKDWTAGEQEALEMIKEIFDGQEDNDGEQP